MNMPGRADPAADAAADPMRHLGLPPVVGRRARLLILGSFPGAASLAARQYYAHPRNAFWPIVARLLAEPQLPQWPYRQRLARLRASPIALWDVYASCRRSGSLDSAIEQPLLNDLAGLLARHRQIACAAHNGGESARHAPLLARFGLATVVLPSSSPAYARLSVEAKAERWAELLAPWLHDRGEARR
jgi:hypoxanthine-DNA glycosylase